MTQERILQDMTPPSGGLDRLLEGAAMGVANGFGLSAMAVPPRRGEF